MATCSTCYQQYVGQTSTSFSSRWNSHRHAWKKGGVEKNDKAALRIHYQQKHQSTVDLTLPQAYTVTFVDKPCDRGTLDYMESYWIQKLQATININRTILPKIL